MVLRVQPVPVDASGEWLYRVPGQWTMDILAVTGSVNVHDGNLYAATIDGPASVLPAGRPFSFEWMASMPFAVFPGVPAPQMFAMRTNPPFTGANGLSSAWTAAQVFDMAAYTFSGALTPNTAINGTWPHVWCVTVRGDGTRNVYRDGVNVISRPAAAVFIALAATAWEWGVSPTAAIPIQQGTFGGTLQNLSTYGVELTPARVAAHAAARASAAGYVAAVMADAPRAFYLLDEAQPTAVAIDSSGNGRNATYHANGHIAQVAGLYGWGNAVELGTAVIPPHPVLSVQYTPALEVTDGTTAVIQCPFTTTLTTGNVRTLTWAAEQFGIIPGVPNVSATIGTPALHLPPGYTIGSRNIGQAALPVWTNVNLWWDDASADYALPFDYENLLILG